MKALLIFLVLCSPVSLFARLDRQAQANALQAARIQQTQETFHYETAFETEGDAADVKLEQKHYGPYRLVLQGIAPGTRFGYYSFNLANIDDPLFVATGYIDQNGIAWIKRKDREEQLSQNLNFFGSLLPGEPMFSLIVLADQKTYLAAYVIPNPIEAYGEEKQHVTMELTDAHKPFYLIRGAHFRPGEEVTISVRTRFGLTTEKLLAASDGTFTCNYEGAAVQKQHGRECLTVSSTSQSQPLTLYYDWRFLKGSTR